MIKRWPHFYQQLHPLLKIAVYLGGSYGLMFLSLFVGPFGETAVSLVLCVLVIFFTKYILQLEGRSLDAIGWRPLLQRHWWQLLNGILVGMGMLISVALVLKWQTGFKWQLTPLSPIGITVLFFTVLASAYVQEIAFRGYPFQLLLQKYGLWPTQIIIAFLFGLMHLSSNLSLAEVGATMLTTGIGSLIFATAYVKTKNLALPTGIHFGWNFLQILLPRHPSQNGKGFVKIIDGSYDLTKLNLATWLLPYILIMAVVVCCLYFLPNKTESIKK